MFLHELPKELINPYLDLANTLIQADGIVEESEQSVLQLYAVELNLEALPELHIVDFPTTLKAFDSLPTKIKKEIYFELFSLSYADSSCSEQERSLLNIVAEQFNIEKTDAEMIENITIKLLFDYEQLGMILNG